MKEKSIYLYPHEVRGVIQGRQTRITRVLRPQPKMVDKRTTLPWEGDPRTLLTLLQEVKRCPYSVGTRLRVRETCVYNSPYRSRLVLKVTGVRVERARDIVDSGIGSIILAHSSWAENHWVWIYNFKRVEVDGGQPKLLEEVDK